MTRLGRLPAPPLAPAACLSCGSHTDPQGFFDLGQSVELFGACYLCATCVTFMAKTLHMVGPDVIHNARQEAAEERVRARLAAAEASRLQLLFGEGIGEIITGAVRAYLEEHGESDADAAGSGTAGGGDGGGGRPRRDGRSRRAAAGDRAPAGPSAGYRGSGALAPAGDSAGPLAG